MADLKISVNALSGLYLISTSGRVYYEIFSAVLVSMPSRAYTSFLRIERKSRYYWHHCVNALSGLYLISTQKKK